MTTIERVRSDLLGDLSVPATDIYTMAGGLFGFPECRRFALVPAARPGTFWLQSLEYGALAFLVCDPFQYFAGYTVDLAAADQARLDSPAPDEVLVLSIVTLPAARGESPTANLQGPVVFNTRGKLAHQAVLTDTRWGTREPLVLQRPAEPTS